MLNSLEKIAIERLGLIVGTADGEKTEISAAVLAELAHAGIQVSNPEAINDDMLSTYKDVIRHANKMRGAKTTFVPLFSSFPEELPDWDDSEIRFSVARSRIGSNPTPTDDEIREAMDFSNINWWPASSVPQDAEATIKARQEQEGRRSDAFKSWLPVRVVSKDGMDAALKAFMQTCFDTPTSLREDVSIQLKELMAVYGVDFIDPENVKFRETRVLLLSTAYKASPKALVKMKATPTDVLRLFADLTAGDVSLSEKITYPKLSRAQRRAVVNALEASGRLGELFKYRDLWLKLDRGLHIGEFKAPKTRDAFKRLRDTRHDSTSLGSRFEALLATDVKAAAALAWQEAPSTLMRSLRRILSLAEAAGKTGDVIDVLNSEAGAEVPLKVLYAVRSQLLDNGATYPRVVISKSGDSTMVRNAVGHLSVSKKSARTAIAALDSMIATQLAAKGDWSGEKIFISDELNGVLLPDQLRSTAQGLIQAERGSRFPAGPGEVIRLFTHWKQAASTTDLDLSCVVLDDDFNISDYVSWTRLGNGAMVHSGDIISAPKGAEEFIDINISKLAGRPKWRYLAMNIYRFSGETFDEMAEATAGWMMRKDVSQDVKTFDVSTVSNVFELTGPKRTSVPLLYDIKNHEILYIDTYTAGQDFSTVERDGVTMAEMARAVDARRSIKINIADAVKMSVAARGGVIVKNIKDATLSFGSTDDFTFNVKRPEALLVELL